MTQSLTYSVYPFSPATLAEALRNEWVDAAATRRKQHFHYFAEYLGPAQDGLGAQTILVEEPYLSQSFLADYADYYARGFTAYPRLCKRVHFFRVAFDRAALDAALLDPETGQDLWDSYLGYIVVKPLPARQIGATLLRPYTPAADKQRVYPVRRPYAVNVLGKQLVVETLIFQEQDNNVSACATTALWMAFHKTAFLFQTALPSPYHITAASRNLFYRQGRTFPSTGLDQTQIGEAIQAIGLVAELRTYRQDDEWAPGEDIAARRQEQLLGAKGFIYAYLRLGLPVLLFLLLDGREDQGHLITVTGYRLAAADVLPTTDISLAADALDRLYAHDDQMGPFARYSFTDDGQLLTPWPAGADWETAERWQNYRVASLYSVFVPLAADIRITYEQVFRQVGLFEQLFADTIRERTDMVWDIYLDYSNHYKDELRRLRPVEGEPLRRILVSSLPKYVWVARATLQKEPILEMVFDATDLHTGFYCLLINVFTPLRSSLAVALSQGSFRRRLLKAPGFDARFLTLLLQNLEIKVGRPRAGH